MSRSYSDISVQARSELRHVINLVGDVEYFSFTEVAWQRKEANGYGLGVSKLLRLAKNSANNQPNVFSRKNQAGRSFFCAFQLKFIVKVYR